MQSQEARVEELSNQVFVLSDRVDVSPLPEHSCLLRAGLRSLMRDDVDAEFANLTNLRRVVDLRILIEPREKLGILLQPDPDPDGIACAYALRALLGRKSPTAPLISFGEVKRPENRAMVQALGIDVRTIEPGDPMSSTASRSSTSSPRCSETTHPRACARWTW